MRRGALATLTLLVACARPSADGRSPPTVDPMGAPALFVVGGTAVGLVGTMTLQNRGTDALTVASDGSFRFPAALASGALYTIGVAQQPPGQTCTVSNGVGVVDADVNDIVVLCASSDTAVASLRLTQAGVEVPLAPSFSSDVASYRANLFALVESTVDVAVETAQPGASWSINGVVATSGKVTMPVPFAGATILDIAIDSPGRDHTGHYSLTVHGPEIAIRNGAPDNARFGRKVATDGQRIAVGEPYVPFDDGFGTSDATLLGRGRVHIYAPASDGGWLEEAVFDAGVPSNPETGWGDEFGVALALAGNILVVGAPGTDGGFGGFGPKQPAYAGKVYVYRRELTGWARIGALASSTPSHPMRFGQSVATDGTRIAVANPDGGTTDVFLIEGDAVSFETSLPTTQASAVAFAGDKLLTSGCWLSTNFDVPNGALLNEQVSVYRHDGLAWSLTARPTEPPGVTSNGCLGALAYSNGELVIGAPFDASFARGVAAVPVPDGEPGLLLQPRGAVYVYAEMTDRWNATAIAKQTDPVAMLTPMANAQWPRYGFDVAIDGTTMLVGAPGEPSAAVGFDGDEADVTMLPSAGAAYLVTQQEGGWEPRMYLKPSDTASGLHYGVAVALSHGLAVVGSMRGVYTYRLAE